MATATGSLDQSGFSRLPYITKDEMRTIEYLLQYRMRDPRQKREFIRQFNEPNNGLNQRHRNMITNALNPDWVLSSPNYDRLTFIEIESLLYQGNVNRGNLRVKIDEMIRRRTQPIGQTELEMRRDRLAARNQNNVNLGRRGSSYTRYDQRFGAQKQRLGLIQRQLMSNAAAINSRNTTTTMTMKTVEDNNNNNNNDNENANNEFLNDEDLDDIFFGDDVEMQP